MDLSQAVRIRITNLINERNLNVSKLSTMAGISRSTLSKFLAGKRKIIRLDMIEYICEGLNMKLKDFFNDPVFDNIDMGDWILQNYGRMPLDIRPFYGTNSVDRRNNNVFHAVFILFPAFFGFQFPVVSETPLAIFRCDNTTANIGMNI